MCMDDKVILQMRFQNHIFNNACTILQKIRVIN
jgi:hypothetical protein